MKLKQEHGIDEGGDEDQRTRTRSTIRHDMATENSFTVPRRSFSNGGDSKGFHAGPSDSESLSSRLCLTNQGRVYFKDVDEASLVDVAPGTQQKHEAETNGLLRARSRNNTGFSQLSVPEGIAPWEKVQQIIQDDEFVKGVKHDHRRTFSGAWKIPSLKKIFRNIFNKIKSLGKRTVEKVEDFSSESTFAVVTFTSRQAAIAGMSLLFPLCLFHFVLFLTWFFLAARHCLADGRGVDRWTPAEDIPVPPLADAAAFDFKTCRGCCRPVTLTVNSQQQFMRKYTALFILVVMYVFYTLPLTFISTLVAPEKLEKVIPGLAKLADENPFFNRLLQGVVPAILNSLFFALCPVIFKAISNFGSNAISVNQAEYIALQVRGKFQIHLPCLLTIC